MNSSSQRTQQHYLNQRLGSAPHLFTVLLANPTSALWQAPTQSMQSSFINNLALRASRIHPHQFQRNIHSVMNLHFISIFPSFTTNPESAGFSPHIWKTMKSTGSKMNVQHTWRLLVWYWVLYVAQTYVHTYIHTCINRVNVSCGTNLIDYIVA